MTGGPLDLLHRYRAVMSAPQRQPQVLVLAASPLLSQMIRRRQGVGRLQAQANPWLSVAAAVAVQQRLQQ
jgi:hypothetical protein